jgi:methylmalonyl-CoA/ethylmalonyl-CoA epimerase
VKNPDEASMGPDTESGEPLPFLKNGVAQVAIVVKDLEATVEQYWKTFGIGPWHFYTYKKPLVKQMSYHGQPANYSTRLALAYIGPMRIELIEVDDRALAEGNSIHADFVREHGYGFHHLGMVVDDIDGSLAQAEAAGLAIIQDGSGYGLDGDGHYAYLDTEARFGATLELIQRPRGRVAPEKIYPPETG